MIIIETMFTATHITTILKSQQQPFQFILKYHVAGVCRAEAADNSFACIADGCRCGDRRRSGGMMLMVVVVVVVVVVAVMMIITIIIYDDDDDDAPVDDGDDGDNDFVYD